MEQLLQKPPASTIRFVSHASGQTPVHTPTESTRSKTQHSLSSLSSTASATPQVAEVPPVQPQPQPQPPRQQPPVPKARIYTATELDEARPKRQQQMAQLQARFRASIQTISSTELQLSLDSVNQATMPVKWQGPLWVNILIPVNYPLDPCEVRLKEDGHNPEIEMWRARNVEEGFRKIVTSNSQLSLFQLLNLLNRDLKDLMNLPQPPPPKPHASSITQLKVSDESGSSSDTTQTRVRSKPNDQSDTMGPKSNVIYVDPSLMVPPPQKVTFRESDVSSDAEEDSLEETDSDEDETDESEYDSSDLSESEDEEEDEASAQGGPNVTGSAPKRGIEVRMPEIKLEHISLLYCRSLSLVARCNRCKTLVDIPDLVPDENDAQSQPSSGHSKGSSSADHCKWKTCHICTSVVGAHFRTELIHLQSKTLGYLDLAGCTAFDILPSSFVPTCGECDQVLGAQPPPTSTPAVSAADLEPPSETDSHPVASTTTSATVPTGFRQKVGRGMTATANCRRCHVRMSLTLDGEMKFVKLSPGDLMKASSSDLKQLPLKKKNKAAPGQDIELKVGEPLPKKGTCSHYKRSRRWFRFPCCQRLYPCDTCHEEKEDHVGDTAKRMVCGYCSREQVVSDKPCVCGESPVKSAVGAGAKFWEGGEGMRDPSRLSNKDARKYRGLHKTEAKKQVGPENLRKRAAKKRL
ncbi:hypothetical protein BGW38_002811 [Lunasporangiospora selenospora]|uniref:CHY-type domain-containing protein n=1 Tax=Lunasporangiospora selenospora TaxID=979761 RepID=A0A9P6KD60_9FUNG|nr:hypothetical protein BGW38_002811 [Lunasporangiospora selenospora]